MSTAHHHTIDYLRQCFRYENGELFWLVRPTDHFPTAHGHRVFNGSFAGKLAGHIRHDTATGKPRWIVTVDGKHYRRARIVWLFHHGVLPVLIDHENRDQLDDRIENLRVANKSLNAANTKRSSANTSGYKGVSRVPGNLPWRARIKKGNQEFNLGRYSDPAEAHAAYCKAAKAMFGEFSHDGE